MSLPHTLEEFAITRRSIATESNARQTGASGLCCDVLYEQTALSRLVIRGLRF